MGLRELLILLLGFAIVAVILRGLYVAMQARRGQIRLAIDKNIPKDIDLDALEMAELPGGGARVVSRAPVAPETPRPTALDIAKERAAAMDLGEEDDAIPVLMDSVAVSDPQEEYQEHYAEEPNEDDDYEQDAFEDDFEDDGVVQLGNEDWEDPDDVLLDYGDKPSDSAARSTSINNLDSVRPDYRDEAGQASYAEQQGELAFADGSQLDEDDDYSEADYALDDTARVEADEVEEDDEYLPEPEQTVFATADGDSLDDEDNEDDFEEDDDSDEFVSYDESAALDYDDEVESESAHTTAAARDRVAPSFDPNVSLDDDPFSMTAGERIGYQEKAAPPARSLFGRFGSSEGKIKEQEKPKKVEARAVVQDEAAPAKRSSLFSAIGRKVVEQSRERFGSREDEPLDADPVETELSQETHMPLPQQGSEQITVAPNDPPPNPPVNTGVRPAASSGQPTEIRQQSAATQPSEVIVLNVMAREGYIFHGEDLMPCLLTSGLKFGEMAIFHQRLGNDSRGPVIFSVANILNPGTFDLNDMANFTTVGVSMFLALPSPINNLEAFELMLKTARHLCATLDGEMKDDHRNVMTAQTIEHYRQRIRDFELRQLRAAGSRG
jgi:cell division protein ZipA